MANVWSTFKNVLKDVVAWHLDSSDAQEIATEEARWHNQLLHMCK